MGNTRIKVLDVSGSRVSEVEAPDDVPVNRLLALLIERMNLPLNSPDGQIMSYKLHHRRTGQQLLDNQTLAQAGVVAGDELRLQPEITAGAASSADLQSAVAPICNRQGVASANALDFSRPPQNAILRYSRLQICATSVT